MKICGNGRDMKEKKKKEGSKIFLNDKLIIVIEILAQKSGHLYLFILEFAISGCGIWGKSLSSEL